MAKVLIIDDDPIVRVILSHRLAADNHEVLTADDGEAGLNSALVHQPDVVILDVMMPRMHGFAVVEAIRKNPGLAHARIIVCSIKAYASDTRTALNLGADRFLAKPVPPDLMARTVAELAVVTRPGSPDIPKMRVKFWGTRGSIAVPGSQTVRYGGNTACTEVRLGGHILILDAGTGIRGLGSSLLREFGGKSIHAHVFIGHTHWDHIQGFPFFAPAYLPNNTIFLYSMRGAGKPLEKVFRGQMDNDYFPVLLSDMQAALHFVELIEPVTIGPLTVGFEYLNHPGIAIGFRISAGGKTVVYASDHEGFSRLYGAEAGACEDRKIIEFARGADLFICEAQYTVDEYPKKKGWGHSTMDDALGMAAEAQVKQLAIFHHDPSHDDEFMDAVVGDCRRKICAAGHSFACFAAREGQEFNI